jgi:hypothetical protein
VNEKKEERIMPLIVATYVCHAARLQRRTGSTRTSLGPIMPLIVATTFATQPVYNDARAAHALRSDQHIYVTALKAFVLIYYFAPFFASER